MRAEVLSEPLLEFAGGERHLDPKFGIREFGPADLAVPTAPRQIKVGLLGVAADIAEARNWLEKARDPISGKSPRSSRAPERRGLFPAFPGFASSVGYHSELVFDSRLQRAVKPRALEDVASLPPTARVNAAVELYLDELRLLAEEGRPDVVVCVIPDVVLDLDAPARPEERQDVVDAETAESSHPPAFHDLFKARAMPLRVPLQLARPRTFNPSRSKRQKRKTWKLQQREDDATLAWNFFTALYYKAGGTPWRMPRATGDFDALYAGVAFYRTPGGDDTATSVAQVYNQRGDGVVVRGGPAARSNEDQQLHLAEDDAYGVVGEALGAYKREHRHLPARVTVHKTSPFDEAETAGMERAVKDLGVDACELIWVTSPTTRLFRDDYHPPLRGTLMHYGDDHGVLYTKGSVEWYGTYPGMYVPKPIALRAALTERGMTEMAKEVLALSKMNWNSTRFDGRLPVSLRTARHVADIIKHLPSGAYVEPSYAYYM